MMIEVPVFLQQAAVVFASADLPLYLVGGRPRNALLGVPGGDWDLCGAAQGEQAAALFMQVPGVLVHRRDTELGTLGLRCGDIEAEYTAFRAESYPPGGAHRPASVRFGVSLDTDALRRDFTANALYWDIENERLLDPLGGQADIQAKLLRTCRAPQKTFGDDGLRLMRLARFCAELHFTPEEGTAQAARERAALLQDISPERLWGELKRLLLADTRYDNGSPAQVALGLGLLDELRLLDVFLPELAEGRGVGQRTDYHDSDVLRHGLAACAAAPPDLKLRLAALLHDIGKPAALKATARMVGHDRFGAAIAAELLARLRCPKTLAAQVCELIASHMVDLDGRMGEGKLRLRFVALGRQQTEALIELRRADVRGSRPIPPDVDPAAKWVEIVARMEATAVPWTRKALNITGQDIATLLGGEGPEVGRLLAALHRHAVIKPKDNNREALLRRARQLLQDSGQRRGNR